MPNLRLAPALLLALALSACAGRTDLPAATGRVLPTVAGRTPTAFADRAAARCAFTRVGGTVTATLEDAAWLRFEGDPQVVASQHRAYFEYGYTTFEVELRSSDFANPTAETFVLEDSAGARLTGSPVSYEGSQVLVDDRYFAAFTLSFPHVLTGDTAWIRLTRASDGSSVEWRFEAEPEIVPAPAPVR